MEITKQDWKLFREKLPVWQDNYMENLFQDYMALLQSDRSPSTRFEELYSHMQEDRKTPGVWARISKAETVMNVVSLLFCKAITIQDLADFSEEFQAEVKRIFHILETDYNDDVPLEEEE